MDRIRKSGTHTWECWGGTIQNIGAYGVEVEEYITSVQYLNVETLDLIWIDRDKCDFAYRNSIFKELKTKAIITEVQFKLPKNTQLKTDYESLRYFFSQQGIHNLVNNKYLTLLFRCVSHDFLIFKLG